MQRIIIMSSLLLLATTNLSSQSIPAEEKPALAQLVKDAEIAMRFKPFSVTDNAPVPSSKNKNDYYSWAPYQWPNPKTKDGFPYIGRDGVTNPETEAKSDKPLLRKMAVATETLALAYQHTKQKRYAKKSADFIRTWFLDPKTRMNPNLNFGQCTPGVEKGTATGIIDSRWLVLVVDAVSYLKGSEALTGPEQAALKSWFKEYLNWLRTSDIGIEEGARKNNHGTWYAAQAACFAIYAGDTTLAREIVNSGKAFFNDQIDSAGRQIHELSRTKSYDYSLYNVHGLIRLAQEGDAVGVDLWHHNLEDGNKRNIKSSIEYLAAFADDSSKWPYQQIAKKAISLDYNDGDHFSVYYPYDLYNALLIAYKVYKEPAFKKQIDQLKKTTATANRSNLH
jgi:hypothetical protein